MSEFLMRVSDIEADQADCERRGLIPSYWPVSGDDLARYVACI